MQSPDGHIVGPFTPIARALRNQEPERATKVSASTATDTTTEDTTVFVAALQGDVGVVRSCLLLFNHEPLSMDFLIAFPQGKRFEGRRF